MNTKLTGPATRRTVAALVALLTTALTLVLLAGPARADTVTVRSTADPGDGACGQSNACTLREAIDSARSGRHHKVRLQRNRHHHVGRH